MRATEKHDYEVRKEASVCSQSQSLARYSLSVPV
jgi:hypothetical protein